MDFSEAYRIFLKANLPVARDASGGAEVYTRCQYCPDSLDPTHGHMYIKIPRVEGEVSTFYCQKCHTSGLVTNAILMQWGIYDTDIAASLININKKAIKNGRIVDNEIVYSMFNYIHNQRLAMQKLGYINDRLGTNLTLSDAVQNRVIFNLGEVLEYNRKEFKRDINIIRQLNDNFVGFLSMDNNFITLRKLCKDGVVYKSIDKKYIIYNAHGKTDNTEKYYIPPFDLSLSSSTERIKIHIGEGPFDILSIKHNMRRNNNDIYVGVGGSGYMGAAIHIIYKYALFYSELHFYVDADMVGNRMFNYIQKKVKPYGIPVYIHINGYPGEKDFGVPNSRIKENIIMMGS